MVNDNIIGMILVLKRFPCVKKNVIVFFLNLRCIYDFSSYVKEYLKKCTP